MENKTMSGFLNYWLEQVMRGNVRQSTYMAYRGYIVNHIQEHLGTEKLIELKTERLQKFIAILQTKQYARFYSCYGVHSNARLIMNT